MNPLSAFPITATNSVHEAEAVMSSELADLRLQRVRHPADFHLTMNGAYLGEVLLSFTRFATDVVINPGELDGAVAVLVGVDTPSTVYVDQRPIATDAAAAVISPSRDVRHHYAGGGGFFVFRVGHQVIEQRLQALLDRTISDSIQFAPAADYSSRFGDAVRRLAHMLVDTLARDPQALANPLLQASFDEMVINTIVAAPSNYSEWLDAERGPGVAPAVVRRAEAYLEASAAEPVTIEQLVEVCGCSRRSLFQAFQRSRGYTPMQFLADCRLRRARAALLDGHAPADTVSAIAYANGFSHPSRFAATYLQRYGEHPSQTLRRTR